MTDFAEELAEYIAEKTKYSPRQETPQDMEDEHNYEAATWMIEHGRRKKEADYDIHST